MPYNIALQNAIYNNVPAVDLPISGGGTARFYDVPCVHGQFTAKSSAGVQTINVPYNGSGYPVAICIYVAGGCYNSSNSVNATWYNLVQRYGIAEFFAGKTNSDTAPNYGTTGGNRNSAPIMARYKSSTSSPTTYSVGNSLQTAIFSSSNPSSTNSYTVVKMSNAKTLNIYVTGGSNYGFVSGIKYDYYIVYSS